MNMNAKAVVGLLLLLAFVVLGGKLTSVPIESTSLAQSDPSDIAKRIWLIRINLQHSTERTVLV